MDRVDFCVGREVVSLDPRGGERVCKYQASVGFEPETLLQWSRIAIAGTVLDIGCYSGLFSIAACKLGAQRVVALEPMAAYLERIRDNAGANGVGFEVFNMAADDQVGEKDLTYASGVVYTAGASLSKAKTNKPAKARVHCTTIDALALENVHAIKIDVEGHELPVLRGGLKTIMRDRPKMIIECWDEAARKPVMALLPGYRIAATMDGRNILVEPK